jgi:hypothetical protein
VSAPRRLCAAALGSLVCASAAPALDEALYAELLARHTRAVPDLAGTRVDYRALTVSPQWRALVASLAASEPSRLASRDEQLAFWIDAYNILAIELVLKSYPVASIRDAGSIFRPVWKRTAGRVGGRGYSLDEIEHDIVRPLGDPRVHAALVCASTSCPALRREPFRAAELDRMLDAATQEWLADPRKGLRLEPESRTLWLSKVFDWFEPDFAAAGGVRRFAARYAPEAARRALEDEAASLRIRYLDYDWSLNDLAPAAR